MQFLDEQSELLRELKLGEGMVDHMMDAKVISLD